MKKILISVLALTCLSPLSVFAKGGHGGGHFGHMATGTGASSSKTHVSGYTTKHGIYVAPHNRSSKDRTKSNNWSTKGNVNPETGKAGSK